MSRIGKLPVKFDAGVTITVDDSNVVTVTPSSTYFFLETCTRGFPVSGSSRINPKHWAWITSKDLSQTHVDFHKPMVFYKYYQHSYW